MLDVVLLVKVVLIGALTAAGVMLLASWASRRRWPRSVCWSWAVGAGVLAASGATDQWPNWPALEDRARFLTLLVPITLVVETVTAAMRSGKIAWVVRAGLAAVATPILLHDSIYLTDLNGPNSAEWSTAQATIVLGGIAVVLALVWAMLSWLQARTSTRSVLWILILDAAAAAFTVMLSGYYRGGLLGLGLTAALAGATLASYVAQPQPTKSGGLGMSVMGIFAVVLVGRFFGSLATGLAACLLLAPLLACAVELPRLRTVAPRWRAAGRLACVAGPLIVVVTIAQRNFTAASVAPSRPSEPNELRDRIEKPLGKPNDRCRLVDQKQWM